ncbi:hypothetical protein [Neorhizobium tomejilense]|uniref:hypothetical protein n=1 Tax=Neorhizobium tomejilense TaxID=2093828 RepID=UPI00155EF04D|nr:hypothetical protein [Neorhizobium tomejilense]
MIADIARAATTGFGASFGRDVYRSAKKNPLLFVAIGASLLVFGWRNLFMGIGRSALYFFFVNLIGSLVMIVVGGGLVMTAALIFEDKHSASNAAVGWGFLAVSVLSLVGILWGLQSRRAKAHRIGIERRNVAFLAAHGFTDAGFESTNLQDAEGHILKLIEQTDDRLVFSVAGRRGLRAAIRIEDGEMVSYTGVVKAA